MKINNVVIRSGIICAVMEELPEEPNHLNYKYQNDCKEWLWKTSSHKNQYSHDYDQYKSALQLIKDNAVPFSEQFTISILLHSSLKIEHTGKTVLEEMREHFKDDTFYPVSVEVEIKEFQMPSITVLGQRNIVKKGELKRVARIVEEPVQQQIKDCFKDIPSGLDKPIKFPKRDSQVEDQEEIIKLIDSYWKFDDNQQPMSSWHDKQDLIEKLRTGKK